jgi:MoaA/NifB/PqqE/SkfB family radical SAM enzyme
MNFDQNGTVSTCCFNRTFSLGKYPNQTLIEIWQGKNAQQIRKEMALYNFNSGCHTCERMIEEGHFESVLIKHFDDYHGFLPPLKTPSLLDRLLFRQNDSMLPQPTVFEFELSNTCNLECIMCGGKWSSGIREPIQ